MTGEASKRACTMVLVIGENRERERERNGGEARSVGLARSSLQANPVRKAFRGSFSLFRHSRQSERLGLLAAASGAHGVALPVQAEGLRRPRFGAMSAFSAAGRAYRWRKHEAVTQTLDKWWEVMEVPRRQGRP